MRIVGSNRLSLNPNEKETLARMSRRDRHRRAESPMGDGESDESLEEISADDFKRQDARDTARSRRVWNYQMPRDYAQRLSSFAWAQAVQNKPLGLDLMPMTAGDLAKSDDAIDEDEDLVIDVSSQELDGEKEDGEIEEGEIESGSEQETLAKMVVDGASVEILDEDESIKKELVENNELDNKELIEMDSEDINELDKLVGFILEELDTITVEEAEASFEAVCSKLHKCFENLKTMFRGVESADTVVIALVQQALGGIQTVYSVLNSESMNKKEENKDLLLRLLIRIKNQYSFLFSPEQVMEIDALVKLLVFEDNNKGKEVFKSEGSVKRPSLDSGLSSVSKANAIGSLGISGMAALAKLDMPSIRPGFSPLLDLHAIHDEGSLPSPTRDNPVQFPTRKPVGYGMRASVSSQPKIGKDVTAEVDRNQHYVTEALEAVSSYGQRYGKISFPESPTPSEERNADNDDSCPEISSSTITNIAKIPDASSQFQTLNSSGSNSFVKSSVSNQVGPVKPAVQISLGTKPTVKPPPSKSRDPRLRFLKPETPSALEPSKNVIGNLESRNHGVWVGSPNNKKQKMPDDSLIGDQASKRQKNGFSSSRELPQMQSGRGGWLEDGSRVTSQTSDCIRFNEIDGRKQGTKDFSSERVALVNNAHAGVNGASQQNPSSSSGPAVSLPSLLKAVNPTILMQLVQMEQQRLVAGKQQQSTSSQAVTNASSFNVMPGTGSANSVLRKEAGITASGLQLPAQTVSLSSQNNGGRRMKPRDPRRILHNNTIQKSEILDSEQVKDGASMPDTLTNTSGIGHITSREQVDLVPIPSKSMPKPDINRKPDINWQLAKNLKHLAGTVVSTSPQTTITTSPLPYQINQSVTQQTNQAEGNLNSADSNESKIISSGASQSAGTGSLQQAQPWGDVDHLLDGYDDEQKATIQRERARRIDEQNKMFASRKLCLVLDLDHTLLNSAKFVEIEPDHEDLLRRKEDIDREKPLRHLFRFQHMGMWTKLRPGVWNFLEKASKLYELHLYTMGNKLYATEMAKVLDPTGNLFSGRVISRGDDTDSVDGDERVPKSKDLDGVLGMESAVVIIDDSVRVWPHNKHNLIVVERYTYFPCSRRQFGLLGPSLLEIDHDERPEDGTLAAALTVIERIHQTFFSHVSLNEVDVRSILAAEKQKILSGCKIVFSRIIPVAETNPHLHPLWQLAEQFGAVCTTVCDETVTHVVANSLGTDKVNWAFNKKKFVVHPGWLEASALLYRRANEHDFTVTQLP